MKLDVKDLNGRTFTVLLDGEDVSNRTFAFDDIEGWVDCYVRDEKGDLKLEEIKSKSGWKEFELVKERLFGEVFVIEDTKKEENG